MTRRETTKLIKKFGGWWDEIAPDVARFPSHHAMRECSREFARLSR